MPWQFCTSTGGLYLDGRLIATGYSGHGDGRNNPEFESLHDVGPIPQGQWMIVGPPFDSPTHGPSVLRLLPRVGTETFGRSGFLMHGDSYQHPGEASLGCIILPMHIRQQVWASSQRNLVVAHDPPEALNA